MRRAFLTTFSFLWILFSPLTLGALFPIVIAVTTRNDFMVWISYIIYSGLWFWIHDKWVIKNHGSFEDKGEHPGLKQG